MAQSVSPDPRLINQVIANVGRKNCLVDGEDDLRDHITENRDIFTGRTAIVAKPASVLETQQIVKLAAEYGTAIVPQGGRTGHMGGTVPSPDGSEIVISLERMKAIREVDVEGNLIVAEAGVVLQNLQDAALAHDRFFPLSLASQGSCTIGGNISTNAGGVGVLAYGSMRDQVLGLEVVLASGEIWNGLSRLRKDNTGYSLKNLFIGAEGTLGIVTAAVLKLQPNLRGKQTAIAAVNSPTGALELLGRAQQLVGRSLTTFELLPEIAIATVVRFVASARRPLETPYPWYVLVEISSERSQSDAEAAMELVLEDALEHGTVVDAVIAHSGRERGEFWQIRETLPLVQKQLGGYISHDISVPLASIPQFISTTEGLLERQLPGARLMCFGHLGDGNLHFNLVQPEEIDTAAFLQLRPEINSLVYDQVVAFDGSVSAEHGVGLLKTDLIAAIKQPVEIDMMRAIKRALDPLNIMNPGKVLAIDR